MDKRLFLKVLPVITGALLGFSYYYFIGCRTGSCPITGNPLLSSLYGAAVGLIFIFTSKKKQDEKPDV